MCLAKERRCDTRSECQNENRHKFVRGIHCASAECFKSQARKLTIHLELIDRSKTLAVLIIKRVGVLRVKKSPAEKKESVNRES